VDSEQLLTSVSLFQKLEKKHIRALARLVREQEYTPGQLIVQEGQPGLGLYILAEGTAEVRQGNRTVRTLKTGDFFGEMSLLDDLPRTASVQATSKVTCLTLSKWEFLGELEAHPQMALPLLPMLSRRVRAAEERAEQLKGEFTGV
jgi:CRP-like cAMP-binding protein